MPLEDESVLMTIKKLLGITNDYEVFDTDLIIFINTSLNKLSQISEKNITIRDGSTTWVDLLGSNTNYEMIKTYIYISTKLIFDPPSNAFLVDALKSERDELSYRINVENISSMNI